MEVTGVSIIEPSGLANKPLIPANCLICAGDPLDPESAYINTELNESDKATLPSASSTSSFDILSIIDFAIISLALVQISIALLYFSPFVTSPDAN